MEVEYVDRDGNSVTHDIQFFRTCAEMDRSACLGIYKSAPRLTDTPSVCCYCNGCLFSDGNEFFYLNTPREEAYLCCECGSSIEISQKESGNLIHYMKLKKLYVSPDDRW